MDSMSNFIDIEKYPNETNKTTTLRVDSDQNIKDSSQGDDEHLEVKKKIHTSTDTFPSENSNISEGIYYRIDKSNHHLTPEALYSSKQRMRNLLDLARLLKPGRGSDYMFVLKGLVLRHNTVFSDIETTKDNPLHILNILIQYEIQEQRKAGLEWDFFFKERSLDFTKIFVNEKLDPVLNSVRTLISNFLLNSILA